MQAMWKKADIILAAVLLALGCLGVFLLGGNGDNRQVVVRRGGDILYRGSLTEEHTVEVDGAYHNVIQIQDGEVFFASSDCPNKDCVHMGAIGQAGGMLACAPNGVVVAIESGEEGVDIVAG